MNLHVFVFASSEIPGFFVATKYTNFNAGTCKILGTCDRES